MTAKLHSDDVIQARERLLWRAYAEPRFQVGTDRERALHELLKARVRSQFDRLRRAGDRAGRAVDFCWARLTILVIQAMEVPCEYCGGLFGLEDFGITQDLPLGRVGHQGSYDLANLRACCAGCARAKGPLMTGSEWRDVQAALRAAHELASALALEALAAGYRELALRARRAQGTSPTTPVAGNARGGVSR